MGLVTPRHRTLPAAPYLGEEGADGVPGDGGVRVDHRLAVLLVPLLPVPNQHRGMAAGERGGGVRYRGHKKNWGNSRDP